jgi:lipid-A-disaccharide synthase
VAKRLVRYPDEFPDMTDTAGNLPVAMPNLIAGRRIVPELLQDRFTAQNVAAELAPLLADTPERHAQIVALLELRHSLLARGSLHLAPLDRAADIVVDLLNGPAAPVPRSPN